MLGNGFAELLALGRIGDAVGDQPLGHADAHRADMQPAAVEHAHRDLEAFALCAEPVLDRYDHVVEDHVGDLRALLPHLLLGFADRHAGQVARHEERADTPRAPGSSPVRAMTVNRSALSALVMKRLVPDRR